MEEPGTSISVSLTLKMEATSSFADCMTSDQLLL
jgi:hypothetical protein